MAGRRHGQASPALDGRRQPIEALWMAAGDPLRQLKASIEMSLRRDDMREGLLDYLRSLEL